MKPIEPIDYYLTKINRLWPDFQDDGLSGGFPDWIYDRWNLRLAGRVHDWNYCIRCHRPGIMTRQYKKWADKALRKHARQLLPWYLWITPLVLYRGVSWGGDSSFDTCSSDVGERCRHNIKQPVWMQALKNGS